MDTRATIINTCATRQQIYEAKKTAAFEAGNDERFDRFTMASEVCSYVLHDILKALGLPTADENLNDEIGPIGSVR